MHSEKKFELGSFLERKSMFNFICNFFRKRKESGKFKAVIKMVVKRKQRERKLSILKRTWNIDVKKNYHGKGAVSPLTAFVECETEIIRYTVKRARD